MALQTNNCRRSGEGIMLLTSKLDGRLTACVCVYVCVSFHMKSSLVLYLCIFDFVGKNFSRVSMSVSACVGKFLLCEVTLH